MIGEIGGTAEEEAAEVGQHGMSAIAMRAVVTCTVWGTSG